MSQEWETTARSGTPCEGWWEEIGFGRQPMQNLRLRFQGHRVVGSGSDIVGPFSLVGTISAGGQVAMVKRYLGQHSVDYLGTYDGEGTMWGEWWIGSVHDRWMIKITRPLRSSVPQVPDAEVIA